ncbi:MAG: hypothetical protein UX54_C0014G0003 [Parcubacteria group bacterium GW2011_GWA2_46_39]|nr:MAG: hypothetical protein UX54_C0014G0003 [Parcubacteria group bacterium GW2011_GWA2_46_39]
MQNIILWMILGLLGIIVIPVGLWLIVMAIAHGNKMSVTSQFAEGISNLWIKIAKLVRRNPK